MEQDQDKRLSELLASAQAGDNRAYQTFLIEASAELRRFLAHKLNGADQVEDILQETLIAIHKARHTYLPDRPLGPWIYAIAKFKLSDSFRKSLSSSKHETGVIELPEYFLEPEREPDRLAELEAALRKLPGKQKQIIELMKGQGLSTKEVALKLGMSESAVKVTAHRGYKEIRRSLGITDEN